MTKRGKLIWTFGNLLMLSGLYMLLLVGGLFANEQYNVWASQGDSTLDLPAAAWTAPVSANPPVPTPASQTANNQTMPQPAPMLPVATAQIAERDQVERPHYSVLPKLNAAGSTGELNSLIPQGEPDFGPSLITRIQLPTLKIDKKVQEVLWRIEEQNGANVAIWDVPKYTVGHHHGTANPGQAGNIVLSGHSGGYSYPFNDLYYIQPGEPVILWQNDQRFTYNVTERIILDEVGPTVTEEQRRANARYIEAMPSETVTLVTCWPLTGPNKFHQRVVIRAVPQDHSR